MEVDIVSCFMSHGEDESSFHVRLRSYIPFGDRENLSGVDLDLCTPEAWTAETMTVSLRHNNPLETHVSNVHVGQESLESSEILPAEIVFAHVVGACPSSVPAFAASFRRTFH